MLFLVSEQQNPHPRGTALVKTGTRAVPLALSRSFGRTLRVRARGADELADFEGDCSVGH